MDLQAEKDKIERVTGLGRKTREEIAKWNQMTALRFQTGGRHQTSPASLRGAEQGMDWLILIKQKHISHKLQFKKIRSREPITNFIPDTSNMDIKHDQKETGNEGLSLALLLHSAAHSSPPPPSVGRPGMSDVSPLSGISGLSFDSTLLSPLLFFCLVLLPFLSYRFLPVGPFF